MTEIEVRRDLTPQPELSAQMDYAKAVAVSSLLPRDYQGKPANVLIAIGLGQSMGLSPAESLYRISVIQGKPTASAELIAASVRKAGHILRVHGDETTCTATIIRKDDPGYEHVVTRDLEWAKGMGLASKDNYRKQPGTMLQWRAITAVARLACPEALYGVAYTPDEMYDFTPERNAPVVTIVEPYVEPNVLELADAEARIAEADGITPKQLVALNAAVSDLGLTREQKLAGLSNLLGRDITSSKELTKAEAGRAIDSLAAKVAELKADETPDADYDPTLEPGFGTEAGA